MSNAQNLMASDVWLGLIVVVVLVVAEIGNSRCLFVAAELVEDCAKYVADLGLPCVSQRLRRRIPFESSDVCVRSCARHEMIAQHSA
jgi:hypothetical protein